MNKLKIFLFDYFSKEFLISPETLEFFEINYECVSPKELEKLLKQEPHLIKLIVYPDETFKQTFYKIAPPNASNEIISYYSTYLRENIKHINIIVNQEQIIWYPYDNFFQDFFLSIKWNIEIPDNIVKVIEGVNSNIYAKIIFKLKQAKISWNDNVVSFFEMFFIKFKSRHDLEELIDLILCFFNYDTTIFDLKTLLIKRLATIRQYLSSAISTSEKIDKMGLEFVLTSKIPVLDVNREQLERESILLQEMVHNLFPDLNV